MLIEQIQFALKPLEIKLTHDLKTLTLLSHQQLSHQLSEGQEEVLSAVRRLEHNLTRQPGEPLLLPPAGPVALEVPEHIHRKFEDVLDPEHRDARRFPLRVGINGFTYHLMQCHTRFIPDGEDPGRTRLMAYLNLMKSVFILQKIKQGDDYRRKILTQRHPMWVAFMEELEERCRKEYARYTPEEPEGRRLQGPTRGETISLWLDDCRFTLKDDRSDGEDGMPNVADKLENEILHLAMATSIEHATHELGMVRLSPTLLQMQSSTTTREGRTKEIESTIDLETAELVPTWAELERPVAQWKMLFKESKHAISKVLGFAQDKDLHQFQQAITGYRVGFDNSSQDAHFKINDSSKGFFGSGALKPVVGKVQLWYSSRIDANIVAAEPPDPLLSTPTLASPNISTNHLQLPPRHPVGRFSPSPVPLTPPPRSPYRRASRYSIDSHFSNPSSITTNTTVTAATSVSQPVSIDSFLSAQTATSRSGAVETNVTKYDAPREPMLVLLIRQDHRGRHAPGLFGIKMDAKTDIEKHCACSTPAVCTHAHIRRAGSFRDGALDAYRAPTDGPAGSAWNLGLLGAYQLEKCAERAAKLKWVQIIFNRPEERAKFVRNVARVKQMWENKMALFRDERERVRKDHIV